MKKQKLITFDLDQTLVKTTKAHALAFKQAFQKHDINIRLQDIEKLIDGRHSYEIVKALRPKLKKSIVEKIVRDQHKFLKKTVEFVKPIEKAYETLKFLKRKYKLALVTNSSKAQAKLLLKAAKIPVKVFDFIVCAEQSKNLKPKPWPDEIFKAKKLANVSSDIHVGDSVYDVIAAKRAKAIAIAVLTGKAKKAELKKQGADCILKNIALLPRCLSKISKNF
ncbi:MAG: HAD-IA family hydrolase [Candidatus Pacearchaeota archaeon]